MSVPRKGQLSRRAFLNTAAVTVGTLATGRLPQPARAAQQAPPRPGGILRISVNQRPNTLNPIRHVNNAEYMLGELLYSGLTRLAPNMTAIPDLAVSWAPNRDLTRWTFTLRRSAKFQTGQDVTSADVVATIDKILDPKTASPGRLNIGPIDRAIAKDPYTVEFQLKGPYTDLPVALAYTNAKIIPRDVLETRYDQLATQAFGSGPFRLREFVPGSVARVVRNPQYFVQGRPYLEGVDQAYYPDAAAEVAAFLNKETDLISELPQSQVGQAKASPGVRVLRTPSGRFVNVVMGCDRPPFSDPRVRLAMQAAVDRTAIVQAVAEGLGEPAEDTPISRAYRYFKAMPSLPRDVQKARRLLAEAGYAQGLSLPLMVAVSPPARAALAVALQEMVAPAGFRITVQQVPYDTYLSQVWLKSNFYVGFYNMQANEDSILNLLFTSNAPWNESKWNNKGFDDLVAKARTSFSSVVRSALYGTIQETMYREAPNIIPLFMDLVAADHDYVQNFALHPRGAVFSLDQVWLTAGAPRRS